MWPEPMPFEAPPRFSCDVAGCEMCSAIVLRSHLACCSNHDHHAGDWERLPDGRSRRAQVCLDCEPEVQCAACEGRWCTAACAAQRGMQRCGQCTNSFCGSCKQLGSCADCGKPRCGDCLPQLTCQGCGAVAGICRRCVGRGWHHSCGHGHERPPSPTMNLAEARRQSRAYDQPGASFAAEARRQSRGRVRG